MCTAGTNFCFVFQFEKLLETLLLLVRCK
uniref:Uncharacterized protein n=1 Tax=Medicago truncatula TaxID=3880 RepID=I3SQ59_MEDTR|nr:unknown [Medicago truncatula]